MSRAGYSQRSDPLTRAVLFPRKDCRGVRRTRILTGPLPMPSLSASDPERTIEFEFVRATENAALNSLHWLGRGEKERADAAACDAIYGAFDLVDIAGEVVIGEGIKDNAPGIFLGEHLGTWRTGSPRFEIALDPIRSEERRVGKGCRYGR